MSASAQAAMGAPPAAAQTTCEVLEWALNPGGFPPSGVLGGIGELPQSTMAVRALQVLARATAARVGAGRPALGDPSPIGPGALFLAAAVGGRIQPELAARVAALVAPPVLGRTSDTGWAEALARHSVVAPALAAGASIGPVRPNGLGPRDVLPALAEPLTESLLRASPLSAVLIKPADGGNTLAVDVALGMMARPHGTDVLASVLSQWDPDVKVLLWRARLLSRLAASHTAVALEVYAAALLCHGAEWDHQLEAAAVAMRSAASGRPDDLPVATLRYWAPMLARQVQEKLPQRRLLNGYGKTLSLIQQLGLDSVGDM